MFWHEDETEMEFLIRLFGVGIVVAWLLGFALVASFVGGVLYLIYLGLQKL
jgi:hypothetical protein